MTSSKCECSDPGCPVHEGKAPCSASADTELGRVDMAWARVSACEPCADDMMRSGLFVTDDDVELDD